MGVWGKGGGTFLKKGFLLTLPTSPPSQGFCVFGMGRGEGHAFCPRWAASRPSSNRGWRVVASLRAAFPPSPLPSSPNESPFPKQYAEQGFDNVKSFGKERGRFWGGEDDRMAPPERAVPVDASPRLTGIDSNAGSLSEERFPLPQFSVHPNEEVWTTESLNR